MAVIPTPVKSVMTNVSITRHAGRRPVSTVYTLARVFVVRHTINRCDPAETLSALSRGTHPAVAVLGGSGPRRIDHGTGRTGGARRREGHDRRIGRAANACGVSAGRRTDGVRVARGAQPRVLAGRRTRHARDRRGAAGTDRRVRRRRARPATGGLGVALTTARSGELRRGVRRGRRPTRPRGIHRPHPRPKTTSPAGSTDLPAPEQHNLEPDFAEPLRQAQ